MAFSPDPIRIPLPDDDAALDELLASLPACSAVFLLDVGDGQQPYLARTGNLKRRALRLLRAPQGTSRMLNLRGMAREIVYWPFRSSLASSLILLEQARRLHPQRYRKMLRLRMPFYVELLLRNRFPRCILTRAPQSEDASFGPFLYRSHAEEFLNSALDLFLVRRCEEELSPSPQHPGCIYGEMAMCLRPCQAACSDEDYRRETRRLLQFLASSGEELRAELEARREDASTALDFEEAARLHKRLGKLSQSTAARGGFARMLPDFHGVAVTRAASDGLALLWPCWEGRLQGPVPVPSVNFRAADVNDALRPTLAHHEEADSETQRELLAVLTKWKHSSWCDGEWIAVDDPLHLPTRKLVNAVRRVCAEASTTTKETDDESSDVRNNDGQQCR